VKKSIIESSNNPARGDRLLVVGESEEVAAFDELAKGKPLFQKKTCLATGS